MDNAVRRNHFIAMLGSCWDSARLAGLRIHLSFSDGTQREGHPTVAAAPASGTEPTMDHTGVRQELELDGLPVDIDQVRTFAILWAD